MNDASEVLVVIFDCLHRSFITGIQFLILYQWKAIAWGLGIVQAILV
jgi:hypothetical protein